MNFFFLDSEFFSIAGKLQPGRVSLNSSSHVAPTELLRGRTSPSVIDANSRRWVRAIGRGSHCREVSVAVLYAYTLKSCPLPPESPVLRGPEVHIFITAHVVVFGYAGQREFRHTRLPLKETLFNS